MAANFPSSPSLNDTFTHNDITWIWTGKFWRLLTFLQVTGYTGSQGYSGSQGNAGTSVKITGSTSSYADLPFPYGGNDGDGFITTDNGYLAVWASNTWTSVGQVRGYVGSQGYTGSEGYVGSIGYVGSTGEFSGTFTGTVIFTDLTPSTGTDSGSLVVMGGVGIGKSLYVASTSYIAGAEVVTTATIDQFASKTYIYAGTDTAVDTSTGIVTVWSTSTLESITGRGNQTTSTIHILNTTLSTSSTTGALIVDGGIGLGGNLFVYGSATVNGAEVLTSSTIDQFASKTYIYAGTDTAVDTSTGIVTVWSTSTLESITSRGSVTPYSIKITSTETSTSSDQGALVVSGDVGISGTLRVSGEIIVPKLTVAYTTVTTNIVQTDDIIQTLNTSASTSSITGALIIAGGAGIGGDLNVGGLAFVNGAIVLTSATVNDYANQTTIFAGTDTAVDTSTGIVTIWVTATLESITNRSNSTTNRILILNTTGSTSTDTGALIVSGGVAIQDNLYVAGGLYLAGNEVITSGTIYNYAAKIYAGTDTSIDTSTGAVTVWSRSTLQSITDRGSSTTNLVRILNTTESFNSTTGALVISGGVGIGGNLVVGGEIISQRLTIEYTTITTNIVVTDDIIQTSNQTASTGTSTGALVISGGAGIGGTLYVANTSYIAGAEVITTATIDQFASKTYIYAGTDTAVDTSTGIVTVWSTSTLQSVTDRGNSTTNIIHILNSTTSIGTGTGALIVDGGVSIGDNLYVASTAYINGAEVLTSSTIDQFASKTYIYAGTDTAVDTSTGIVTVWSTSTLQSVTDRGNITTNTIIIDNFTDTTGTDTGALIVRGGLGIGGGIFVGSTSYINGAQVITTATIEEYVQSTIGFSSTGTATFSSIRIAPGGYIEFLATPGYSGGDLGNHQYNRAPKSYTNYTDFTQFPYDTWLPGDTFYDDLGQTIFVMIEQYPAVWDLVCTGNAGDTFITAPSIPYYLDADGNPTVLGIIPNMTLRGPGIDAYTSTVNSDIADYLSPAAVPDGSGGYLIYISTPLLDSITSASFTYYNLIDITFKAS